MEIRRLVDTDVEEYRALRLRALREHPEAFGTAFEEMEHQPLAFFAGHIPSLDDRPDNFMLGAFERGRLIGVVSFLRSTRVKSHHKGEFHGMHVASEAAGWGVGRALLEDAIGRVRAQAGLEQITLGVVRDNDRAHRLYERLGFAVYGTEPCALKLGDRCLDEDLMVLRLR